ncbi:hypothetical protein PPROV_000527400 [Pycnococcus provasolii]|uniref:Uncharacterized protein n=1 Tax=Pycnococcus provasolii TaxID=41880 RepID=A0A830HMZ3_9CHLO|nr:hypothetical protein PPROV_000527400 [Pycnococcus provasolii]
MSQPARVNAVSLRRHIDMAATGDLQLVEAWQPFGSHRTAAMPSQRIAVDFVSVENAQFAVDLVDDYRGLKQGHAHKEDVLEARASWRSASATPGRRAACMPSVVT